MLPNGRIPPIRMTDSQSVSFKTPWKTRLVTVIAVATQQRLQSIDDCTANMLQRRASPLFEFAERKRRRYHLQTKLTRELANETTNKVYMLQSQLSSRFPTTNMPWQVAVPRKDAPIHPTKHQYSTENDPTGKHVYLSLAFIFLIGCLGVDSLFRVWTLKVAGSRLRFSGTDPMSSSSSTAPPATDSFSAILSKSSFRAFAINWRACSWGSGGRSALENHEAISAALRNFANSFEGMGREVVDVKCAKTASRAALEEISSSGAKLCWDKIVDRRESVNRSRAVGCKVDAKRTGYAFFVRNTEEYVSHCVIAMDVVATRSKHTETSLSSEECPCRTNTYSIHTGTSPWYT